MSLTSISQPLVNCWIQTTSSPKPTISPWLNLRKKTPAWLGNTRDYSVDGRNPAPVDRYIIPLFTWFYTSQGGARFLPSTVLSSWWDPLKTQSMIAEFQGHTKRQPTKLSYLPKAPCALPLLQISRARLRAACAEGPECWLQPMLEFLEDHPRTDVGG